MLRTLLRGALAGAAGTTALDAATYLDMLIRGRPESSTPEQVVERVVGGVGVGIPGTAEQRGSRVSALGSLAGIATGVAVGAMYGLVRGCGVRPPAWLAALGLAGAAMVGANGPMTALGVTDPRSWSGTDWLADAGPHLAYGAAVVLAFGDG